MFVHVLDPDGEQMWTDDHLPPTPTSQWKPGQTVEYTRTVFVPIYPYVGEAVVRLGLYDPTTQQAAALNAPRTSRREEYQVAKFQLQPQTENIFLIFKDGWHPAEVADQQPAGRVAVDEEDRDAVVQEPEEGLDVLSRVRRPQPTCSRRRSRSR